MQPGRQNERLRPELEAAFARVLERGCFLSGPETERFEEEFARFLGAAHCVAVANGTDALELALRACGAGDGAEVITVANAGGYTTTACRITGAVPVYVDVDPASLLIDLDQAVGAVSERTACIVVTHLYGRMADAARLRRLLDDAGGRHVRVIEDAAQAHGASRAGRRAGSVGDLGAFSFYPTKNLGALGDAGAVVTSDADLHDRIRKLRQYGWRERFDSVLPYGRNSRMDEIQAAALCVKLPHLGSWNRRRRAIVAAYREAAPERADFFAADGDDDVAHLAVARVAERDRARGILRQRGIATDVHYPRLDHHQRSQHGLRSIVRALPESERAVGTILSLPCFPELEDAEVDAVCRALGRLP